MDGKNIQTVVEIAAKLSLQDHSFQVAMSRSDDANVNLFRPRASQTLKFPLLQDAQKLRLELQRDVTDFVQEQGTLVCQLDPARFSERWLR